MSKFFLWVIVLAVFGYGIYLGIRLTKVRLNYSSVKNEAEMLLDPGSTTPLDEVPGRLLEKAKEQNIPLREQDIRIYDNSWDGYKVLTFDYVDSLMIFDIKTFYFKFSFIDTVFNR